MAVHEIVHVHGLRGSFAIILIAAWSSFSDDAPAACQCEGGHRQACHASSTWWKSNANFDSKTLRHPLKKI